MNFGFWIAVGLLVGSVVVLLYLERRDHRREERAKWQANRAELERRIEAYKRGNPRKLGYIPRPREEMGQFKAIVREQCGACFGSLGFALLRVRRFRPTGDEEVMMEAEGSVVCVRCGRWKYLRLQADVVKPDVT